MAVSASQNYNHGHKARHDESNVDLDVCEHDEPSVPMTFLEFSCTFGTRNAAGWIFATVKPSAAVQTELAVDPTQCQSPAKIARL